MKTRIIYTFIVSLIVMFFFSGCAEPLYQSYPRSSYYYDGNHDHYRYYGPRYYRGRPGYYHRPYYRHRSGVRVHIHN